MGEAVFHFVFQKEPERAVETLCLVSAYPLS